MDIKTQTKRKTDFKRDLINLNIFVNKSFEFGIVTSKYWGDFENREDPLIEIEVENQKYNVPLSVFKELIKDHFKVWKDWDYTK